MYNIINHEHIADIYFRGKKIILPKTHDRKLLSKEKPYNILLGETCFEDEQKFNEKENRINEKRMQNNPNPNYNRIFTRYYSNDQ